MLTIQQQLDILINVEQTTETNISHWNNLLHFTEQNLEHLSEQQIKKIIIRSEHYRKKLNSRTGLNFQPNEIRLYNILKHNNYKI